MKIVRVSNFDLEGPQGNQRIVAFGIENQREADKMADALNNLNGDNGPDFFKVVADDYILPPPWEP